MDPLTHALLGASAARVALARPLAHAAWLPGAAGALLPDADALIRSSADPLLYAEFHRHFTHALAFIPIGGATAALPFLLLPAARARGLVYLGAATVGYATHGLLDACTTYGTVLLWPFSDARLAWNVISIVDPIFTFVLLCGVTLGVWRRSARAAAAALLVCTVYLATGAVQRDRALDAQRAIAAARGAGYDRGEVFPGFANLLLWRSLYQAGDTLHMDRIRVPITAGRDGTTWSPGTMMPLMREQALPPADRADARVRRDFHRFRWFTSGWMAPSAQEPSLIGDARYSTASDRFDPVWGIRFVPVDRADAATGGARRTEWVDRSRERTLGLRGMVAEFLGRDPAFRKIGLLEPPPGPSSR